MKVKSSFTLGTEEIKQALIDYINTATGSSFTRDKIDGFQVSQSSDDIRVYTAYIGLEEASNGR